MQRITLAALLFVLVINSTSNAQNESIAWSDEFNGESIDRSIWTYDVGGHGFGNGQLEFNTARSENSYIENGNLVIEARREPYRGKAFTSARMLTQGRFAFKYGALEARIKVPNTADGIWPAFWMLGNNFPAIQWPKSGEVDILEIGGKEGTATKRQGRKINCALHFSNAAGVKTSKVQWLDAPTDLYNDFHLYRVSWTPKELKFFLDGKEFASWDITDPQFAEFHQPCFPILNVAVGSWPSSYTATDTPDKVTATFPAKMRVDWIRLYRNKHTKVYLGKDRAETGPFGVFTEDKRIKSSLQLGTVKEERFEYGTAGAVYRWNNLKVIKSTPSEGKTCLSWKVAAGAWFGSGILTPTYRNMTNYSDGRLHFDIKTSSPVKMRVGIKSSHGGEFWLPLGNEKAEFGFRRNGEWQRVSIPLNRFANTDFQTIHQLFMIAGDAPKAALELSIDNIWWEPSVKRPAAKAGSFGIFTSQDSHRTAGEFKPGPAGDFFVWEKTLRRDQGETYKGQTSLRLSQVPGAAWSGAAFTPNVKHDLSALASQTSRLHFAMKTKSQATFMIGMKSGNVDGVGQSWISFQASNDPYGFRRDGQWHVIEIPLARIAKEVDLSQVSQLFQLVSVNGPIDEMELADICILQ